MADWTGESFVATSTVKINTNFATQHFGFYNVYQQAVSEMTAVLNAVQSTGQIPEEPLYHTIFPAVEFLSDYPAVYTLLSQLETKEDYITKHSIAVGILSKQIGKALKYPEQTLTLLMRAGTLHDVGKMAVPISILNKPGKLTTDEFEEVKQHTIYGYEMILRTSTFSEAEALSALNHHERVNGEGYPHRKKAMEFNELAKIVSVADVFHAMNATKSYHHPLPFYEVLVEMSDGVFGQFDPVISMTFIRHMMEQLIGEKVVLSDGRIGVIRMIPVASPTKPFIEVSSTIIDLNNTPELNILRLIP